MGRRLKLLNKLTYLLYEMCTVLLYQYIVISAWWPSWIPIWPPWMSPDTINNDRNGFLAHENVGIDTKILHLWCLGAEIWLMVDLDGGHFEIQDGVCCHGFFLATSKKINHNTIYYKYATFHTFVKKCTIISLSRCTKGNKGTLSKI